MTARGVAFSYAAILVDDAAVQAQIGDLLRWLVDSGVDIAILSTHPRDIIGGMSDRGYTAPDAVIFRDHVGKNKGAPEWMTTSANQLGIELSECFSVGVSKFDWISAVNAGVVYIHAGWAGAVPADVNCLVAETPADVAVIASHFLLESPRWSFALSDEERIYELRSLLPASAVMPATNRSTFTLQNVFTYENPVVVGSDNAEDLLMLHALSSAHLEGLIPARSFFAIYPGSRPGALSAKLRSYLHQASTFFKAYVRPDLLVRAARAPDTSLLRARARREGRRDPSSMLNQSNTVHLDSSYRGRLAGRTVVVFDDFTTSGMSLEWARNLLELGGAAAVVGLSIGKYGSQYRFYDLVEPRSVDPFSLNTLADEDFETTIVHVPEIVGNATRLAELLDRWVRNA